MTDPQRKAELIRRLRIALRLCQGDCSDRELMAFARAVRPLTFARVSAVLTIEIMVKKLAKIGRSKCEDHSEGKYRVLFQTQFSINASLRRRVARLKAENVKLRAASQGKSKTP